MGITKKLWGHYKGQQVYLLTISNGYLELSVTNFGCTLVSIKIPGDDGIPCNMILGYDSLDRYIHDPYYMGSIVGRYANRISGATFNIGDEPYPLSANEPSTGNHLHGGDEGFNKKVFDIIGMLGNERSDSVQFYYRSPDGEEGYPGNLDVFITYRLTHENEIIIDYSARTDKTTPVNLTSHCYFNLSGSKTPATGHELMIRADNLLQADENYIPTGAIMPVKDTCFDFTNYRSLDLLRSAFRGYNECFIIDPATGDQDIKASLRDPVSGRVMSVKTTLPGMMFYTGDYLDAPFIKNQGICMEMQFFPDSPNQPHFPNTLLQPGSHYRHKTIYQFN